MNNLESLPVYEIDGNDFATLEEFYDVISYVLIPTARWGRNLDAFDDILRGGFGTPDNGFILRWHNASISRIRLGYPETTRQLQDRLSRCHSSNREKVKQQLALSKSHTGDTVFDWLIQIIQRHATDNIVLILQ